MAEKKLKKRERAADEIDEIFDQKEKPSRRKLLEKKSKKKSAETKPKPSAAASKPSFKAAKKQSPAAASALDDAMDPKKQQQSGRNFVDGLPLYTEEELGLTAEGGGDTPLCPFDCECCF